MTHEYDPLTGELLPKGSAKPLDSVIEALPKIDITDHAALKTLAMEALVEIVQTAPRNVSLVSAIREIIDRIEGKAPQSIALDVKDTRMDKMPIDKLLRLASMLDEPVIILPLPNKAES